MSLNFEYFDSGKKEALEVILPGSSEGIEKSELVQKTFLTAKELDRSVVMFDYPVEAGMKERIDALKEILEKCKYGEYKKIRLIGKSLGGIVASEYLTGLDNKDQERYELVILGYIPGGTKLNNIVGKISIFQGGKDKYGDFESIRTDVVGAVSQKLMIYEISGADHSFRDPVSGRPKYLDKVLELLFLNQKLEKEPPKKGAKRKLGIEPVIQKFNYDCGVATVSNLLLMLQREDLLKTDLYQRLEVSSVDGTRIRKIKALFDEEGIEYFEMMGAEIRDLEAVLAVGYICMVCYQAWGTDEEINTLESGHYSVIFDVDEESIWFIDPSVRSEDAVEEGIGVIRRNKKEFDKNWKDKGMEGEVYDHWMLAIKAPKC